MLVVKRISYFKEKVRFALHNTESIRRLLHKKDLSEEEFHHLFTRMTRLECIQMQIWLIKENKELVDKIIKELDENCSNISIPKEFDSKSFFERNFHSNK